MRNLRNEVRRIVREELEARKQYSLNESVDEFEAFLPNPSKYKKGWMGGGTYNGNLDLRNSKIIELPEKLKVKGDLLLTKSQVRSLPRGLVVIGNIIANDSNLMDLPVGLTVHKDLILTHSKIRTLPDKLSVAGNVDVSYTLLNAVPKKIYVKGSLDLAMTPLADKYDKEQLKTMFSKAGSSIKYGIRD